MSIEEPHDREELLAALICQYEQAVRAEHGERTVDASALGADADLIERFDAAKLGLDVLDRVRHGLRPPAAAAEGAIRGAEDARAESPDSAPLAERTIGRFQIQREIGRGGLGVVFLAYDPKLGRNVALKVPRLEAFLSDEVRRALPARRPPRLD